MSSERSYPKPPGEGRPTPPNTETPTVDVAGELATARLGQKPAAQPEPAPVSAPAPDEPRPLWSMPSPNQAPQTPPVSPPVPQASQIPPVAQTPRPSQDSVDQTHRLPYSGRQQALAPGQGRAQESVDETQRLAYPPAAQPGPVQAVTGGSPQHYQPQPAQESVDQTQRLAFPGPAAPVHGDGDQSPESTLAYQLEDTARGQDFQQNQPGRQFQPDTQPSAQPPVGAYGGPTPTLRFDQFPESPGPEQLHQQQQQVQQPQPQTPDGEYRHFGPGVPGAAGAAPNQAAAVWRGEAVAPAPPKPKRRRAFAGWLLALAVLGIVLGILGWFYYFGAPVKVTGATVKGPTTTVGCNQTVTITGTLQTNGDTGSVTYEWLRSDDTGTPEVLTQHFNKGTHQANVVLLWSFKGQGSVKATATLKVLTPNATSAVTTFTYTCSQ